MSIFQKKEPDTILWKANYATFRRTNFLLITIPGSVDFLIAIIMGSDSDDRKTIKK